MKRADLFTLPLRATALLSLLVAAYALGYGKLHLDGRQESSQSGLVVRYSRNHRPWKTYYDRDRNGKWDMWIDERAGSPLLVSIDDNGDGKPDREEDEWGSPLSGSSAAKLRAHKTLVEFLHNPKQLIYSLLAVVLYSLLELSIRLYVSRQNL